MLKLVKNACTSRTSYKYLMEEQKKGKGRLQKCSASKKQNKTTPPGPVIQIICRHKRANPSDTRDINFLYQYITILTLRFSRSRLKVTFTQFFVCPYITVSSPSGYRSSDLLFQYSKSLPAHNINSTNFLMSNSGNRIFSGNNG